MHEYFNFWLWIYLLAFSLCNVKKIFKKFANVILFFRAFSKIYKNKNFFTHIFEILMIHKPSLGSCKASQKYCARSVIMCPEMEFKEFEPRCRPRVINNRNWEGKWVKTNPQGFLFLRYTLPTLPLVRWGGEGWIKNLTFCLALQEMEFKEFEPRFKSAKICQNPI